MAKFTCKNYDSVSLRGAPGGSILRGAGLNNQGLRLRVVNAQIRGSDGPIAGDFVLLDAGQNMHADCLAPLVNRATDAAEVLGRIRRERPGCVSVVNANILEVEGPCVT